MVAFVENNSCNKMAFRDATNEMYVVLLFNLTPPHPEPVIANVVHMGLETTCLYREETSITVRYTAQRHTPDRTI